MAGYEITQFDAPGVLAAYTGAQDRRLNQMLIKRKMDMEDRAIAKDAAISNVYKNLNLFGSKGGGQPSGGLAAPYSTPSSAATPPSAPIAPPMTSPYTAPVVSDGIDRNRPVGSPLSPAVIPAAATAPVAADPTLPAADAPAAPSPPPPASFLEANRDLITSMQTIDGAEAFKLYTTLQGMDEAQLKTTERIHTALAKAALQISSFGSPDAQRAELARITPDLVAIGVPREMIDNFQITPQSLQWLQMEGQDFDKIIARAKDDRTFAETVRHNRATEDVAGRNVGVREGALGLSRQREGRVASGKGRGSSGSGDRDSLIDSLIAN